MLNFFYRLKNDRQFLCLALIIILALSLRLVRVTLADSYTDEVLYSFRAIGMIDYDTSPTQTTTWQWFSDVPWWAHLSFHDHPPLFFLIQFFSMKLLGVNLLAVRLPAVLAGVGSVLLLYLIVKRMFNQKTALLSALLLAINPYHVWISRLGLQDGIVIFLMLLILWFWLKAEENKKYLLWCGVVLGVGLLTKYTILIIFPILFLHALFFRRGVFKDKELWIGAVLMIAISFPIWLYNIFLYKTRGHFDFQVSAFLGQDVPEWAFRMGRIQAGGLVDRIKNFFVSLHFGQGAWLNIATAGAIVLLPITYLKSRKRELLFLLSVMVLMFFWFLAIGSVLRFVVMITPFFVVAVGLMAIQLFQYRLGQVFVGVFILAIIIFSVNSFWLSKSYGFSGLTYAGINYETQNYGFNQLDDYLNQLFRNKYSLFIGEPDYNFLKKLVDTRIAKAKEKNFEPAPILVVTESGLNSMAYLWVFNRRLYYGGWPIMDEVMFEKITGDKFIDYYRDMGVKKFVYIRAASDEVREAGAKRADVTKLRQFVNKLAIEPKVVKTFAGEDAFLVYEF